MNNFSEILATTIGVLFAFFGPIAILVLFIRRRRAKARLNQQTDGPLRETETDLLLAENALRNLPIDLREALIETHDLYHRFTTHRGYSKTYMNSLSEEIRNLGIACELIFQETLPMGVGDAIVEPQGVFELYVHRSQMPEARKQIPGLLQQQSPSELND